MNEWIESRLGDYIKVKHGFAFKGKYITTEENNDILVTPGNFNIGGGFKSAKMKYFTGEYPKEYVLEPNDIIVTMTDLSKETDTLGYAAKIPKSDAKKYLHNQRIGLVQFKNDDINKEYLYWLMRTREYQGYIVGSASGTSIMHTSPTRIEDYTCLLPQIEEQKVIAEVLSSLDNKIDLLHHQNKTLEELARTLFRQWFIEEASNEWEMLELGNFVSTVDNRGKTPPNQKEETPYPVIEVNALGKPDRLVDYSVIRKYVDKETFNTWFRNTLNKYDTLVSTVGSIGEFSMFILERGNIAQNIIALHPENISPFYLYQILKYKKNEIMQLDIGGVQPSIKVPHLLSIVIPNPDKETQNKFDNQVMKFVDKMEMNYNQIKTLENMRDTLLPKLMSGEVRVKYE